MQGWKIYSFVKPGETFRNYYSQEYKEMMYHYKSACVTLTIHLLSLDTSHILNFFNMLIVNTNQSVLRMRQSRISRQPSQMQLFLALITNFRHLFSVIQPFMEFASASSVIVVKSLNLTLSIPCFIEPTLTVRIINLCIPSLNF